MMTAVRSSELSPTGLCPVTAAARLMIVRQAHEADNSMAHGRRGYSLDSKTRKPSLPGVGGYSEPTLSTPTNAKPTRKVVQQFKKIQGSFFV